jgi:hypothetical protein
MGEASFRGFPGRYRITVESSQGKSLLEAEIEPDGKNNIKVKVEGQD